MSIERMYAWLSACERAGTKIEMVSFQESNGTSTDRLVLFGCAQWSSERGWVCCIQTLQPVLCMHIYVQARLKNLAKQFQTRTRVLL